MLFLPGFGLPLAAVLGMLIAWATRMVGMDPEGRAHKLVAPVLTERANIVLIGAALVGLFFWPADGIFQGAFRAILALVLLLSLTGLPTVLPDRNSGLLLGVLLGGAYGGLIWAVFGAGFGIVVWRVFAKYSPTRLGALLGVVMALTVSAPSLSSFGFLPGPSNVEQWMAYTEWAMEDPENRDVIFADPLDGLADMAASFQRRLMNAALGWFLGGALALVVLREGGAKEGDTEESSPDESNAEKEAATPGA